MRKLRLLLPLVLVAAAIATPSANTAPSPVKLSIGSNAQYVSPTTILVPVTVTCPAGLGFSVFVSVQEQNATNAIGSGFTSGGTCTGGAESLVVAVTGTGFTPGKAYASGFAFAGATSDSDTRQIQIVV